jgi:hypothetical protein
MDPTLRLQSGFHTLAFQAMRHACAHDNFPELSQAIDNGFIDVFISADNGSFMCLRNNRMYSSSELLVETIVCSSMDASLLLIKSLYGFFSGTSIHCDNYSNNFPHNIKNKQ